MSSKYFEKRINGITEGILTDIDLSQPYGEAQYICWFRYTGNMMNLIHEGSLIAVKNFSSKTDEDNFCILNTIKIMPRHFAGPENPEKFYPAYVFQASSNISQDWERQRTDTLDDTTNIEVTAIKTGIELSISKGEEVFQKKESIPMPGQIAYIIDVNGMKEIVNQGLNDKKTITAGSWLKKKDVDVLLDVRQLLSTHFAIFGFTGTGKSNFVCTLIEEILYKYKDHDIKTRNDYPVNIIIFDPMQEYPGKLLPILIDSDKIDTQLIYINEDSSIQSVIDYIGRGKGDVKIVADSMASMTNFPEKYFASRMEFSSCYKNLLENNQIKIGLIDQAKPKYVNDLLESVQFSEEIERASATAKRDATKYLTEVISPQNKDIKYSRITKELAMELIRKNNEFKTTNKLKSDSIVNISIDRINQRINEWLQDQQQDPNALFDNAIMTVSHLVDLLNQAGNNRPKLFIITADHVDDLFLFGSQLINKIFYNRRRSAIQFPRSLFIFDEADMFAPTHQPNMSNIQQSMIDNIEILARRGRKFNLGMCLATQRAAYMHSGIMGQPHTYFISSLPRSEDRERVTDSFGLNKDVLQVTFGFNPGNWVILSHNATGLKATPIPICAKDSEAILNKFLEIKKKA